MNPPEVQPLSHRHRQGVFILLTSLFVLALPFLYLYATGYRLSLTGGETSFVSTGGMYVAADRTGASIYIDDELVRETRVFRRAFYAQNIAPGTHQVHVQKEEHHTWVKQLPVYPQLVTEAQAFNLPLVPTVRVIAPWRNADGQEVLSATSTLAATFTNTVVVEEDAATSTLQRNTEYTTLAELFDLAVPEEESSTTQARVQLDAFFNSGQSEGINSLEGVLPSNTATTTKHLNNVLLFLDGDDVFARFSGPREQMPYYYCAEDFELLSERPVPTDEHMSVKPQVAHVAEASQEIVGPVPFVPIDISCDPTVKIDRLEQTVRGFDFFPGSTDFVVLTLNDGVYVVEIDDRAWQNAQPLVRGGDLDMRVQGSEVYVTDGELVYQVMLN